MFRTLVAAGVFTAAGLAGVAGAPAASATPLCQTVSADTVATSPVTETECVPYPNAAECVWDDPSFLPWFSAFAEVCVPAP